MRGSYKENEKHDNDKIDQEIEAGHIYVDLYLSLANAKDESQAQEIKKTMAEIVASSRYVSDLLTEHGPHFLHLALNVLANRSIRTKYRNGLMVFDRDLSNKPRPKMPDSKRKELICA